MANVLIATFSTMAHVHPYVAVALALKARGHSVSWLAVPDSSAADAVIDARGIARPAGVGPYEFVESSAERAVSTSDPDRAEARLIKYLIAGAEPFIDRMRARIRELSPDAAFIDPMLYAAAIACHLENLPVASGTSALMSFMPAGFDRSCGGDTPRFIAERGRLFERHRVPAEFVRVEYIAPSHHILFTTSGLVGGDGHPPRVHLVGASIAPPAAPARPIDLSRLRPGKPLVYLSLGTRFEDDATTLRALVDAIDPIDCDLVVAAGNQAGADYLRRDRAGLVVAEFAPQLKLLESAAAFVSQGGATSVMEGMASGVPMLVVPLSGDQHLQGFFVARAGAGLSIDKSAAPEQFRRAVQRLIDPDEGFAGRAGTVRASYRQQDGPALAAELIEELACHGYS